MAEDNIEYSCPYIDKTKILLSKIKGKNNNNIIIEILENLEKIRIINEQLRNEIMGREGL